MNSIGKSADTMPKICDNKSVGILAWNDKRELLLVERKKYNFGFASPAGHLDGFSPQECAIKELEEEVGLKTKGLKKVLEKRLENPCKRAGGTYHLWYVFEITNWSGEVKPSQDETKSLIWASRERLHELATRLERFLENHGLDISNLPAAVRATNESEDWKNNPGLEPPWYIIYKELKVI